MGLCRKKSQHWWVPGMGSTGSQPQSECCCCNFLREKKDFFKKDYHCIAVPWRLPAAKGLIMLLMHAGTVLLSQVPPKLLP